MKRKGNLLSKRLYIRASEQEYANLQKMFKTTTYRTFAGYLRDLLNQKPVTVRYRSQSLDEFLPVAIAIKNELQAIGWDFHQATQKLNTLPSSGDVKETLDWLAAEGFSLSQKIGEIKNTLIRMHDLWTQK